MNFLKQLKVLSSWKVRTFLVIFVLCVAGVIIASFVLKSKKGVPLVKTMRTDQISHAKQISILLLEFDNEFGCYPSDESASRNPDLKAYTGQYANDYLGKLSAAGLIDKDSLNDLLAKEKTLESEGFGFSYIKGLSASDKSGTPLLLIPMTGEGLKFDPEPYGGRAIVLRIDGSAAIYRIDADGHVVLSNGKNIFEGGKDTV